MKILYFLAYFTPEKTSGEHLNNDFLEALAKSKIHIECYTPLPTRGVSNKIRAEYKHRLNEKLYKDYVTIHRYYLFREHKNPIQRAIRYIISGVICYFKGIKSQEMDVVYTGSTPPIQGIMAAIVSKKLSKKYGKKIPFIYNLQDIFPDSLLNTGLSKEGSFIWKIGRKIEDYTYRNADKIIVISNAMKRNIMNKGVDEDKIEVISNWIDVDKIKPVERTDNTLISEFSIDSTKFIVVYAGNFGAAQGADIVLKVAEKLQEYTDIQFVIFGGGAYFEDAKRFVSDRNLNNVIINSLLPQERVSEVYSLGDVALITCKAGTGKAGMPSKTWSIMACNTPIIASFDIESELGNVLNESKAGTIVQPENVELLLKAIIKEYENVSNKTFGREFVKTNASKEKCLDKYIDLFKEMCS